MSGLLTERNPSFALRCLSFSTHCAGYLHGIHISAFVQFLDDIFMVFIISVLAQFIACVYAGDIYRKANNTFDFFLHKILWKPFETIGGIYFMRMHQTTEERE